MHLEYNLTIKIAMNCELFNIYFVHNLSIETNAIEIKDE